MPPVQANTTSFGSFPFFVINQLNFPSALDFVVNIEDMNKLLNLRQYLPSLFSGEKQSFKERKKGGVFE